jgi:hypothetical protein
MSHANNNLGDPLPCVWLVCATVWYRSIGIARHKCKVLARLEKCYGSNSSDDDDSSGAFWFRLLCMPLLLGRDRTRGPTPSSYILTENFVSSTHRNIYTLYVD